MFCKQCAKEIPDNAAICLGCGVATGNVASIAGGSDKSRVSYVLLGFFLGLLGVHNFYAGYTGRAIAQLLITILIGWWLLFPLFAVGLWALIEICIVTKDAKGQKFS